MFRPTLADQWDLTSENIARRGLKYLISTETCSPSDISQPKESVVFCGKESAMPAIFSIVLRWIDDCIADNLPLGTSRFPLV